MDPCAPQCWALIPVRPPAVCVILSMSLNLLVPQFPHLRPGDNEATTPWAAESTEWVTDRPPRLARRMLHTPSSPSPAATGLGNSHQLLPPAPWPVRPFVRAVEGLHWAVPSYWTRAGLPSAARVQAPDIGRSHVSFCCCCFSSWASQGGGGC